MQINVVLGHLLSGLMLSFCWGGHLLLNLVILLIYFLAFSNPGERTTQWYPDKKKGFIMSSNIVTFLGTVLGF